MTSITLTILLTEEQQRQLEQLAGWYNEWARAYDGAAPFSPAQYLTASLPGLITREYERERDYQEAEHAGR